MGKNDPLQSKGGSYSRNLISKSLEIRYLPRWIVFFIDMLILMVSLGLTYLFLKLLNVQFPKNISFEREFAVIFAVNVVFMVLLRTFAGIIRHSTFIDLFKIFMASAGTLLVSFLLEWVRLEDHALQFLPILSLYIATSFALLFGFRLAVKEFFSTVQEYKRSESKRDILVLGIDSDSVSVARAILDNPHLPYNVVGFLTDRDDSHHARLLDRKIYSKKDFLKKNLHEMDAEGVLVVQDSLSNEEMNNWVGLFLENDLKILKVPSIQKLREGDLKANIRTLQIEDLLNRKPIELDESEVQEMHRNKAVLVTGGAGSIGSELVRQVAQFNPSIIVVIDQAETPLYEIELEMRKNFPHVQCRFILTDVSQRRRLERIFAKYKFSIVYHAAAYKHVPMLESNPAEAVRVNVRGTKNVATLACQYNVSRFVMVSTDKAVNPTNVMGATKRVAELFVQSLQDRTDSQTKFITTRFGNVLGSNGSVIPHFRKQIEAGGPVTVTHPDIVRYFMTIPEACELVMQAGTMGKGGEIFVFDMGAPVKILDLARRMIKLSGFQPDIDIQIKFTGLRPGEKLYEELLSDNSKNLPTPNKKIMVSMDPHMAFEEIDKETERLIELLKVGDKLATVKKLKDIVPEFKSNNSMFEVLDQEEATEPPSAEEVLNED